MNHATTPEALTTLLAAHAAEIAALKAENRRLRERRRELRDPAALEREARRLGMVKAGEKSYVVEGIPRADIRSAP